MRVSPQLCLMCLHELEPLSFNLSPHVHTVLLKESLAMVQQDHRFSLRKALDHDSLCIELPWAHLSFGGVVEGDALPPASVTMWEKENKMQRVVKVMIFGNELGGVGANGSN